MNQVAIEDLYAFYVDTIGRCTSKLLDRSDEEIQYDLLEEFDIGATSFLHGNTLATLYDARLIDDETVRISKEVRSKWLDLQSRSCSIAEIKVRNDWRELFGLCDQLMSSIESSRLACRGKEPKE